MKNFMRNFPKDERLKALISECSEVIEGDYEELKLENKKLKECLSKIQVYTVHSTGCERYDGVSPCSCGLSDLIKRKDVL